MEKETLDYVVTEKGYRINLDKIEEGCLYSEVVCSATTKSKAKAKLLREASHMELRYGIDNAVTFLNIPVVRHESADKVLYKGVEMRRYQMEAKKVKELFMDNLQEIADDPTILYCYIKKRGLYYRDGGCGYIEERIYAGIYSKPEALAHARSCLELTLIPIDIKEHNEYIQGHIERLNQRIIKE